LRLAHSKRATKAARLGMQAIFAFWGRNEM
jgi:hypothetical protein